MTMEYTVFTHQDIIDHLDGFAELLCDAVKEGASVNFVAISKKLDVLQQIFAN